MLEWLVLGLAAWVFIQQRRQDSELRDLRDHLADLRRQISNGSTTEVSATVSGRATDGSTVAPPPVNAATPATRATPAKWASQPAATPSGWADRPFPANASARTGPDPVARGLQAVRGFFFGGNALVRVGIVVLFFGLAFLLKFASERYALPIGWRLAGVALVALGLLGLGWRLRERRPGFALTLQGGAVAILYLTIYAALRLYGLIPASVAFPLLVVVAVCGALLAVRQESLVLAMFATAGGFLAPVLASTGQGNHVVLFSYYAVLNLGVVTMAWHRSWQPLNLLAFVCTFGIGAIWGVTRYAPADFASTEPFLLLFFLMYVLIAVLFALRSAPRLRHYVDGTIVFGTPVVAMMLQSGLVRDIPYGRAWSAMAAAAVYAGLALMLRRWARPSVELLVQCFIALAVAFATLAVPLAIEGHWTAAIWALEGAAILWVGLRQQRRLACLSGLLLQAAAGVAYLFTLEPVAATVPVANTAFLGALLLAVGGLISAWLLRSAEWPRTDRTRQGAAALLAWGLFWWFVAARADIAQFIDSRWHLTTWLGWAAATAALASWGARRFEWTHLQVPALALLVVMLSIALRWAELESHPFAQGGGWAWPLAFGVLYMVLRRAEPASPPAIILVWHVGTLWLLTALLGWQSGWTLWQSSPPGSAWTLIGVALPALAALATLSWRAALGRWPLAVHRQGYLGFGAGGIAVALLLWSLRASLWHDGTPTPLPFIVLFNPLDVTQAVALLLVARWWVSAFGPAALQAPARRVGTVVFGGVVFVALNAVLLRALHHYGAVDYTLSAWLSVSRVQTALSIFWTVLAMGTMVFATRRAHRVAWLLGAALLAAVVVKLFLVDLARVGSLERIISFIVVGALILVIGWLSPLPPDRRDAEPAASPDARAPSDGTHGSASTGDQA